MRKLAVTNWVCVTLLCAALVSAPDASCFAANGSAEAGASLRDISRGGAYIAVEPEASALGGNPAALAFLAAPTLEFDSRLVLTRTQMHGAAGGTPTQRMLLAPNLSYARPFHGRWAAGLGVLSQSDLAFKVTGFDLNAQGLPAGTTDYASSKVQLLSVTPGLAYKLNDNTSIGLAVHISNGATADQAYAIYPDTTGQALSGLGGNGYALRAGIYHRAGERDTLGAYWLSRSHMKVTGGTLAFGPLSIAAGQSISGVTVTGADFPQEYGAGWSHRFGCKLTTNAEYRRLGWSKVRHDIDINPPGLPPVVFPQDWHNQDVFVLGGEFRPDGSDSTVWRAGVNYAKSPVPATTLSPIFAETNEWEFSAGWEREVSARTRVLLGASYSPLHLQTSDASDQFNTLFSAGQPFSAGASVWNIGAGLTLKLGGRKHRCCCERASCARDCSCRQVQPASAACANCGEPCCH